MPMQLMRAFHPYVPAVIIVCDFLSSILIASAVVQFSKAKATADPSGSVEYIEDELTKAKRRTQWALIPMVVSFVLSVAEAIEEARFRRS
jgi:hypothetical protein